MRLSHQLFRHDYRIPLNWKALTTSQLIEKLNLVRILDPGLPVFLPIGQRIMWKIDNIVRTECLRAGFDEVYLPILLRKDLMEKSGRFSKFSREIMSVERQSPTFVLSATSEEYFLDLLERSALDFAHLPVRVFQISDKFRYVMRPKGILRSRQFLMCEMMSFDITQQALLTSAKLFEETVARVANALSVNLIRVSKDDENYVSFFSLCSDGEEKLIELEGKYYYAADNAKGFTRAASIAMYMLYKPGALGAFLTKPLNADLHFGCYGFGLQKCLHAVVEAHRDRWGINFPKEVRPFDICICVVGKRMNKALLTAETLYRSLVEKGFQVLFDDRAGLLLSDKGRLSDCYGVPLKIFVGPQEIRDDTVTFKQRGSEGESHKVMIDKALSYVSSLLQ